MSNNPKIKYAKQRNGEIFYPRTVAEAIRFEDGESLETKAQNGGLGGGDVKNFPVATELEAREASSNEVLMTPLRTLQLLEENGGGVGGGGGGITIPIISSEFNKTSADTGTEISIPFTFYSPNLGKGTLHGLVDGVEVFSKQIPQGSSYADFGVLPKGSHRISIFVVDRGGVYTDTLSYNIRIGALDITSTFDDSNDFTITQVIKIPVIIDTISVDPVYITYTIDHSTTRVSANTGYNIIQLPVLSPGAHKVTISAESGVYTSNVLSYNVIIEDATNLTVISDFDIKEITYRKLIEFAYRVSLKGVVKFTAKYYDNGTLLKTLTIPSGTNIWSTRELEVGDHELKIEVSTEDGSKKAEIVRNIKVIESDYKPMESVSDASLIAYFDATGKTNNDSDRDVWEDKSPSLEHPTVDLYNINYGTNGWIDNALRLNGGAYAVINLQPLKEITNAGLTIDVKYRTRDIGNQDACVLDMRNNDANNKGVAIDTEKIYMNSSSTKISSDVMQEEISRATFVIDKVGGTARIYNNAVLTETILLSESEDFSNPLNMYLGTKLDLLEGRWQPSVFGDCEIYSVRVYVRALESEEIVQNHIADIVDLVEQQEKYELNYMNNMPTMYFYGDVSAMTKDYKVPLRIKYISTDPNRYGESFDLVDCQVSWQGTSSLQYAVKNYKIRLKNQDGSKFKYSPYPDGIKEDTFCLKADYMESSHANNTGMAKFINDQLYDTPTPPQVNDPDVRTTINGFPIQLYIALNDSVEPTYIGIFNFNHDKSCNKSLGLNNEVEGFENCVRFEVKANSDTSAGAFRDDSDTSLREDFELNYPDADDLTTEQQDVYYTSLKRVISWVKNSTAETFKAELEQYFNKEYLIKYFVQAHLFGMVDNLGKNMMIATWDGNVWYPMFYDMDTQLGLDNTGYLEFFSDIDVVEGTYNTSNSKLFTMLRECFADEIAETYCTMRRTGKYSMPTILSYWYGEQVSKIGELQYNKDMEAKYIAFKNDYLFMLHGRRYEHMKKWLEERMLYLDTIYGFEADTSASITIRANTLNTINLDILTYSPQYLKVKWRNGAEQVLKIGRDSKGKMTPTRFSGTVATATDQEIIIYNARQIKTIDGFANANPSVLNLVEASRLIKLECKNSSKLNDVKVSSSNSFLNYIDLRGCTILGDSTTGGSGSIDLKLLTNLTYANFKGTKLTKILFPTKGCNLQKCYLPTTITEIDFQNMPILEIAEGLSRGRYASVTIVNCPKLSLDNLRMNYYCGFYGISANNVHIENSFVEGTKMLDLFVINPREIPAGDAASNILSLNNFTMKNIKILEDKILHINCLNTELVEGELNSFVLENCKIKDLHIVRPGFVEQRDLLDLTNNELQAVSIIEPCNVSKIRVPNNLIGLGLDNISYRGDLNPDNISMTNTSRLQGNTNVELEIKDTPIVDGVLDLSSWQLNEYLRWYNCPASTIKINSNFSLGTVGSYSAVRLLLPVNIYVEGYLKSTNDARVWCSATDTEYPPMENLDELDWDLSNVTVLDNILRYWKNLKKLPNCITPELLRNATSLSMAFAYCTSIQSIEALEAQDIYISDGCFCHQMFYNFGDKNYSATLGNIRFTVIVDNARCAVFHNSFFRSIGDINITVHLTRINDGNSGNMFYGCKNLESVGKITLEGNNTFDMNLMFCECDKLKTFGGFEVKYDNILANELKLTNAFSSCGLEDYSFLNQLADYYETFNMTSCFSISNISSVEEVLPLISKASSLRSAFYKCNKLDSVPDLEIPSTCTTCNGMFSTCANIETVGSIVYHGSGDVGQMFFQCSILKSIEKLDVKNASSTIRMIGECRVLESVDYFDVTNATCNSTENLSDSFGTLFALSHLIFKGTVGKSFSTAKLEGSPLSLESLESLVSCMDTLSSPVNLKISKTSFALLTDELIATASSKNWTFTA